MRVEDRGLIYDATSRPRNERVASFISLCRLSSGAVLCGFQIGPGKHDVSSSIRICRSDDDGATWQELPARFSTVIDGIPGSLSSGELVETSPGRLLLYSTWFDRSEPERPLFDPDTEGILHSKQLLAESPDEGVTWSAWRELPLPGLTGCSSTGPILQWPNGRIALAFESYKEFDDPSPARHGAWVVISQDGGRTFTPPRLVAQDPQHRIYYWDQRLCTGRTENELLAMFWTHDRALQRDLPVHFRRRTICDEVLRDEPIRDTGIPGQIAAPCLLDDGRIMALVVDRRGPMTMTLWQSTDGGVTWPAAKALRVYEHNEQAMLTQGTDDVDYAAYWEDMARWSFGHPAIRPLDNGRVLLAFYAGVPHCLSVHWVRVDVREG
ncbi:MAG: exo-alpha-sialidase [Planctomycetaceae bacterium]|nr:exo-alpha-sialidase [Planctomycetaceae bacterium]